MSVQQVAVVAQVKSCAGRRMPFTVMYRNGTRTPDRFDLPPDGFLEIRGQVHL